MSVLGHQAPFQLGKDSFGRPRHQADRVGRLGNASASPLPQPLNGVCGNSIRWRRPSSPDRPGLNLLLRRTTLERRLAQGQASIDLQGFGILFAPIAVGLARTLARLGVFHRGLDHLVHGGLLLGRGRFLGLGHDSDSNVIATLARPALGRQREVWLWWGQTMGRGIK